LWLWRKVLQIPLPLQGLKVKFVCKVRGEGWWRGFLMCFECFLRARTCSHT
jgi:hypothetical protein